MRPRTLHLVLLASTSLAITACDGTSDLGAGGEDVETRHSGVVSAPAPGCPDLNADPAYNQVFIYQDSNFRKACRVLTLGFYPTDSILNLPHDSISSIKVGSAVRLRAFRDGTYGGDHFIWFPNARVGALGSWDDAIGSARVEDASRSAYCDDLHPSEFALFEDFDGGGDCVVLPLGTGYPTPKEMGIEDDSISSVSIGGSAVILLWRDPWYGGGRQSIGGPGTYNVTRDSGCFPITGCQYTGYNDRTSSVQGN
jgi:hypothetical protein